MQCRRCGFDPWVRKIPLEKARATHSSNLAWRIPWTEEPAALQSMGSQRVRHNVAINTFLFRKKTLDRQKTETSVKKKKRQNICPGSCSQKHVTGNTARKEPHQNLLFWGWVGQESQASAKHRGVTGQPWLKLSEICALDSVQEKKTQSALSNGGLCILRYKQPQMENIREKKIQAAPGTCICHAPAPIYTAFTMSDEYPRGDLEWMGRLCRSHTNTMLFYMKGLSICEYPTSVGSWNQPPEDTQGQR